MSQLERHVWLAVFALKLPNQRADSTGQVVALLSRLHSEPKDFVNRDITCRYRQEPTYLNKPASLHF